MIDIVSAGPGLDLGLFDTDVERAGNILSVQLGSLEYAQDLGIDLEFFLSENFIFQNESFKAYCIEVLANRGVNVSETQEIVSNIFTQFNFTVSGQPNNSGLIR